MNSTQKYRAKDLDKKNINLLLNHTIFILTSGTYLLCYFEYPEKPERPEHGETEWAGLGLEVGPEQLDHAAADHQAVEPAAWHGLIINQT